MKAQSLKMKGVAIWNLLFNFFLRVILNKKRKAKIANICKINLKMQSPARE